MISTDIRGIGKELYKTDMHKFKKILKRIIEEEQLNINRRENMYRPICKLYVEGQLSFYQFITASDIIIHDYLLDLFVKYTLEILDEVC